MKTKFEAGKKYGNDCTIEVLSRTEKTLTIKSSFGTQKIKVRRKQKTKEREILERMPKDILLLMTNKEISEVFGVSTSSAHQVQNIAYDKSIYSQRVHYYKQDNNYEDTVVCSGAWIDSEERKFIKSFVY